MKNVLIIFVMLSLGFITPEKKKIKIFMAGDSTMSIKEKKARPETGWGEPFVTFFDTTVTIDNRAKNGRSTRTFISEGLWDKLINDVKEGDYVFIQFGHNDESKEKVERYTTHEQYKANLTRFVNETRAKNANPILLTPVSRRRFDSTGRAIETHEAYSKLVRELSVELKIPLIDLDKKSQELYQQMGVENSKLLFLQVKAGEHPNYPEGKIDNTHFNELGARLVAQLVLAELRNIDPTLAERIVKPVKKEE